MKVLLITGASSGIGLATARLFSKQAYRVINISRKTCPLPEAHHLTCDLSRPEALSTLAEPLGKLLENASQITVIHNAARLENDSFGNIPSDNFRAVMEINVIAANSLNSMLKPYLKRGSSVIYVGSTLAEKAVPGTFTYVVSKHAIIGMMRATCQDLTGTGVHTACICPGFTDTEMLRAHVPEDAIDSIAKTNSFGRLVEPGEIASTLLFAAENPVLNGTVIHANLGQLES